MQKPKKGSRTNKKSSGAKETSKNNSSLNIKQELISLAIIVLWLLLMLSFSNVGGVAGNFMKNIFFSLLGGLPSWMFLMLLLLIIVLPINEIIKFDKRKKTRILYSLFLTISVASLIATIMIDRAETPGFFDFMKLSINTEVLISGGVIGAVISYILQLLFSKVGAYIIIIALIIAGTILLAHFSFTGAVQTISDQIVRIAKNIKEFFKGLRLKNKSSKGKTSKSDNFDDDDQEDYFEGKAADYDFGQDIKLKGFKETKSLDDSNKELQGGLAKGNGESSNNEGEEDDHKDTLKDNLKTEDFDFLKPKDGDADEGKPYIPQATLSGFVYNYPTIDLLNTNVQNSVNLTEAKDSALKDARKLVSTLKSFGVQAKVNNISRGPTVTRYEVTPSAGVKVSKIVNLSDDIALNLAAAAIRIEAPIPGKAAVGIEIPNKEVETVYASDVIGTDEFVNAKSKLTVCLGKNISGETIVTDIAKMPHLLIAGATGSGKSVCINMLIVSLLYKASPQELNMIMIDPKVVELGVYNGIPHLCAPVVTDPKKAAGALNWAVQEMTNRYKLFAENGVRDLHGYNDLMKSKGDLNVLPHLVIIIDELADLMMVAPREVEDSICRLAQMARAAGMHLIIATQRPSVDVITGVIKANIPSRIAFKVASQVDSRTILDSGGAEKLLGRGDMLFNPVGASKPIRIQGAFISDKEVENVVEDIKNQGEFTYDEEIVDDFNKAASDVGKSSSDDDDAMSDELLPEAIEIVVENEKASISFLQRKLRIGYSRAARIIDIMEDKGIVSKYDGSKPRNVLLSKERYMEMKMNSDD